MVKYVITTHGTTEGLCNPLRPLNGELFYELKDAVERVYEALHNVIESEDGCEFVERHFDGETFGDNDEAYICALDNYKEEVKDYIWRHLSASEDGWVATIGEQDLEYGSEGEDNAQ